MADAADGAPWALSAAERDATVERIAANISTLAFFKGLELSDADARAAATAAERKAYTAAQVAARTTTGSRPAAETTSAYARKLGELVLAAVEECAAPGADVGAANGDAAESVDLFGTRDFLDAEATRAALAPLLAAGRAIRKVRFSTKSFGAEAAAVAAEALRSVAHCLEHADMSDIIAGRPEDEALEALRLVAGGLSAAKLRHLNLSDNALGEKGVRAAAAALQHPGLEFLALQNVGASVHACKAVEELLPPGGALSGLHLFNNMSGDEGAGHIARLLARCPRMADFKMASSRVGAAGGIAIARALAAGGALVRLDLSDNPLTEEVAPALAACLSAAPALAHLNLNDTSLTDAGVATVCGALAGAAPRLASLELALNEVTPDGAAHVVRAIAGKQHLARLNLRENELEDAGAAVLARGLASLPALTALDLCANQLMRPGALAVARAVAAARRGAGSFELLALDENAISEQGVEQLRALLKDAFGSDACLGPLDENDPDMAGDDDDDEAGAADGDDDGLAAALAKATI
ncbi:RANGAP1 [Scenedesmus sp. PABB004]|nr:RANGAP1 [Scenedesmus sp. PABB004]